MVQSHLPPFRNLGNFVHPTFAMSFGRDTKSRSSLLSGVYARESKRSHTGGKCVTCSGLANSKEGQVLHQLKFGLFGGNHLRPEATQRNAITKEN